jgi:DNA repair exonuclease SbcCD ATPase subunit
MANALNKILSENTNLSEDVKAKISEAWQHRVDEAKAELRQEFAAKYQHDIKVLAESVENFISDKLRIELEELAEDKQKLVQERVSYSQKLAEHTKVIDDFVASQLAKEVKELREDRVVMNDKMKVLENFTIQQLSEEIASLRTEKQSLIEQRVKLIAEGKKQLNEAKEKFIVSAAKIVEENIDSTIKSEMSQFKQDIKEARENEFGRRIFETFVGEYMTSHLNESSEIGKMRKVLMKREADMKSLQESLKTFEEKHSLLESKLSAANDRVVRANKLGKLLAPLSSAKRKVMVGLLESVQTADLDKAFGKYLPAVLNEDADTVVSTKRETLAESKSYNGNRVKSTQNELYSSDELDEIKRLAGIK